MSYVFGMSLEYRRYRRDCKIKVYADDNLIDEITLSKDINLKTARYEEKSIFSEGMGTHNRTSTEQFSVENYCRVLIIPEKLFLFEIDRKFLTDCIRLEVENDHNNYTNGFMTNFSHVRFHNLFLVPDCMLLESNWAKLDHLRSYKQEEKKMAKYAWPTEILFADITLNDSVSHRPYERVCGNIFGGKFTANIPLTKKHKIIHLGRKWHGRAYLSPHTARILSVFKALNTTT